MQARYVHFSPFLPIFGHYLAVLSGFSTAHHPSATACLAIKAILT